MSTEDEVQIIEEEEPQEEAMEIEDIAAEPLDSVKINRCGQCRRMQYGHPVPYGAGKCLLDKIADDTELKNDDLIKIEMRKERRGNKRSRGSDETNDQPDSKKDKKEKGNHDAEEQLRKENEELEKKLIKKKQERKEAENSRTKNETKEHKESS